MRCNIQPIAQEAIMVVLFYSHVLMFNFCCYTKFIQSLCYEQCCGMRNRNLQWIRSRVHINYAFGYRLRELQSPLHLLSFFRSGQFPNHNWRKRDWSLCLGIIDLLFPYCVSRRVLSPREQHITNYGLLLVLLRPYPILCYSLVVPGLLLATWSGSPRQPCRALCWAIKGDFKLWQGDGLWLDQGWTYI